MDMDQVRCWKIQGESEIVSLSLWGKFKQKYTKLFIELVNNHKKIANKHVLGSKGNHLAGLNHFHHF